ncbi:hypothetical protein GBF38_012751 [Nibea albiflora]|uniref:Uncharacterized protein n=1 Tax=Nibea albiflora TaxID=240163 RepID=A0ACB7EK51_NIBAL|nr:hypothetical protein GBF38_012751 [Nibea albiflora]
MQTDTLTRHEQNWVQLENDSKAEGGRRGGRRGEDGEDKLLLPASEDVMCERAVKRKQKRSHACQFPRLPPAPPSLLPPVCPSIIRSLPSPYKPTKKTSGIEATSKSKVGSIFDEILEESPPGLESTTTNVRVEVQTYFSEPTIPRSDNPLLY